MPGFDTNRIVGLDTRFADTIQCPICLSILDNPVMTKCGHNYCQQCLKEVIESGAEECPKCRIKFSKKRRYESIDDICVALRHNEDVFTFFKNLTLNEMIGKLKINCDYDFNGCQESVELAKLYDHMTVCEHNICKTCGLSFTMPWADHNCIELLKDLSNDWKVKYEKSVDEKNQMKEKFEKSEQKYDKYLETIKKLNLKLIKEAEVLKRQRNDWKTKYERIVEDVTKLEEDYQTLSSQYQRLSAFNMKPQINATCDQVNRNSDKITNNCDTSAPHMTSSSEVNATLTSTALPTKASETSPSRTPIRSHTIDNSKPIGEQNSTSVSVKQTDSNVIASMIRGCPSIDNNFLYMDQYIPCLENVGQEYSLDDTIKTEPNGTK